MESRSSPASALHGRATDTGVKLEGAHPFNVNHYVRVKLTERGRAILRRQHEAIFAGLARDYPYTEPEADAEGWTEFQLWDLMSRLGPDCRMGFGVPFETEILIVFPTSRPA